MDDLQWKTLLKPDDLGVSLFFETPKWNQVVCFFLDVFFDRNGSCFLQHVVFQHVVFLLKLYMFFFFSGRLFFFGTSM